MCRPLEHSGRRDDPAVANEQLEQLQAAIDEAAEALCIKLGQPIGQL